MRGMKSPLIETVFSKKRNTSIALGKGLGVKNGFRSSTKLGLGTNILESNNRAIVTGCGGHRVAKGFTIRGIQGDTEEISLSEKRAGRRIGRGGPNSPL